MFMVLLLLSCVANFFPYLELLISVSSTLLAPSLAVLSHYFQLLSFCFVANLVFRFYLIFTLMIIFATLSLIVKTSYTLLSTYFYEPRNQPHVSSFLLTLYSTRYVCQAMNASLFNTTLLLSNQQPYYTTIILSLPTLPPQLPKLYFIYQHHE